MGEIKRVLFSKSRIAIILVMLFVMLCVFMYDFLGGIRAGIISDNIEANEYIQNILENCEGKSLEEIDEYLDEEKMSLLYSTVDSQLRVILQTRLYFLADEVEYQLGYYDYLENVQAQAELLGKTSIFSSANTFSGRNITKTADDFSTLDGVTLEFGDSYGITKWLGFTLADYFFLAALVVIVIGFLEERKVGLWSVIRTTKHGRSRLCMQRIATLGIASIALTLLFYLLPLCLSLDFTNSFGTLGRSLQSLEYFSRCTLNLTVAQWLGQYLLMKALCGVLLGLFIWAVMSTVANVQFSLGVIGVTLAVEYLLNTLLPAQSVANVFKYLNIFSYVNLAALYSNYLNVNIFGYPVGIRMMMFAVLPVALVLFVALCLKSTTRYPDGQRDILSAIWLKLNFILDKLRVHFGAFGWELYKVLIYSFGVVIIIAAFLVGGALDYDVAIYESDQWYQLYLSDIEGEITEKTEEYFEIARANAESSDYYGDLTIALDRLELEISEATARAEEGSYTPYILDSKPFRSTYGTEAKDTRRLNMAVAILFVCLGCAGIMVYEKKSGVVPLLKSLKCGRGYLLGMKIFTCLLMATAVWACIYMQELKYFLTKYATPLSAPVQNLEILADFPLQISLGGLLAMIYGLRLLVLMGVSLVVMLISSRSKTMVGAYVASVGILALPSFAVALII
ncbi:MAG: hypothetical protein LUH03_06850 [Oscillospiraceae bacterium]|nr:hypothetical protein [Oscillospiraceae bacterium]